MYGISIVGLNFVYKLSLRKFVGYVLCISFIFSFILINISFSERLKIADTHQLKSLYIYKFINYIEWEGSSENDEIHISILGDDRIYKALNNLIKRQSRLKIKLSKFGITKTSFDEIKILVIGDDQDTNRILSNLSKYPVLTITSVKIPNMKIGVINFFIEKNKLRFEIDSRAAIDLGIKINSRLLNLSRKQSGIKK